MTATQGLIAYSPDPANTQRTLLSSTAFKAGPNVSRQVWYTYSGQILVFKPGTREMFTVAVSGGVATVGSAIFQLASGQVSNAGVEFQGKLWLATQNGSTDEGFVYSWDGVSLTQEATFTGAASQAGNLWLVVFQGELYVFGYSLDINPTRGLFGKAYDSGSWTALTVNTSVVESTEPKGAPCVYSDLGAVYIPAKTSFPAVLSFDGSVIELAHEFPLTGEEVNGAALDAIIFNGTMYVAWLEGTPSSPTRAVLASYNGIWTDEVFDFTDEFPGLQIVPVLTERQGRLYAGGDDGYLYRSNGTDVATWSRAVGSVSVFAERGGSDDTYGIWDIAAT